MTLNSNQTLKTIKNRKPHSKKEKMVTKITKSITYYHKFITFFFI